jgi:serine/threonine protein kinase
MSSDAALEARDEEELAEALEGYFAALETGTAPDPAVYAAGFPRIARRLQRCLAGLTDMHDALASDPAGLSSSTGSKRSRASRRSLPAGHVLGDFRLLHEIGRGGMGVVYEAEQISLSRRVAVKVLPFAAFLDSRRRQRFLNEAHAAATLQHEHIVPVYATGCDQGVHYYAMRLIEGPSLATVLSDARPRTAATKPLFGDSTSTADRRHPAPRSATEKSADVVEAVRLTLQVAAALQHAHELGVVHRDVKPGNILIDGRGHAWLTDFGLARRDAAENLTDAGDLVGTLRYMSPEQASGNGAIADPRSDVYSLGATLYEMLCRRPVFDADDRRMALRRIMDDDPTPLRRLAPHIPRDLETIVHRTLAKNPDGRYRSAAEFASDLERFLADRPILARRPSSIETIRRLVRRHQTAAVASAAALVVAVLALGVNNVRLADALRETEGYRKHADAQRRRAEHERGVANENFREALDAVDVYLLNANETRLRDLPGGATVRREMLQAAANFYERLAARRAKDESLAYQRANAQYRLGTVLLELGDFERAEAPLADAEATFDRLSGAGDGDAKVRLAQTMHAKSRLERASFPAAAEDLRRLEQIEATLDYSGQHATNTQAPFLFVRNAVNKTAALRDRGELGKAVASLRQCAAPLAELVRVLPNDAAVAQQQYAFHLEKARNDVALRRWKDARRALERAREANRRASRLQDDASGTVYRMAVVDFREASLNLDVRDLDAADRTIAVARRRLTEVAPPPTHQPAFQLLDARLRYLRATMLRRGEDLAGAMNEAWAAEAGFATLSTPARYDAYAELRRGETLYFISSLNAERMRQAEALSAALTARAIGESLLKRRPDSARVHALLGRARHGVAGALLNLGRPEEADVEFTAAADAEREACRLAPWEIDYPRFLANHLIGRGRALFALGRQDDALRLFDECCQAQPNHPYYHWATGWELWNRIGRLAYRDGAHKGRFLAAVVERFRRAAELKTAHYLDGLFSSNPSPKNAHPTTDPPAKSSAAKASPPRSFLATSR